MKESTKELLGLKSADLVLYLAFILVIPAYFSNVIIIDVSTLSIGFILCLISCFIGMKPHPDNSKATNILKLITYPLVTLVFVYLAYLNFANWNLL